MNVSELRQFLNSPGVRRYVLLLGGIWLLFLCFSSCFSLLSLNEHPTQRDQLPINKAEVAVDASAGNSSSNNTNNNANNGTSNNSNRQSSSNAYIGNGQASELPQLRDPFAVPPEYQQLLPEQGIGQNRQSQQKQIMATDDEKTAPMPALQAAQLLQQQQQQQQQLQLLGVASAGERQAAIISLDGKSKSYQPGDYIGMYQLLTVQEHSVILTGPKGQRTLNLGR